jgi:hypothetical protein
VPSVVWLKTGDCDDIIYWVVNGLGGLGLSYDMLRSPQYIFGRKSME